MMLPVRVWHRLTAKDGVVACRRGRNHGAGGAGQRAADRPGSLEALALRAVNMPIGSSLMCLARKP